MVCQQVKAEHQRPAGLLQPLPIPEWKWESITMDFVTGFPTTTKGRNAIWVVIDHLTKSAHFISIKKAWPVTKLAETYIKKIVKLHGVPINIISDRDPRFTSRLWQRVQDHFGSKLQFSTASHPQTDGQSERTILILEDMLRACALDFGGSWKKHLPLIEFAYNNSYQSTIRMAPYEALYGRKCRPPLHWDLDDHKQSRGDNREKMLQPELVQEAIDKVHLIRQRIQTAQARRKSYADNRRRDLEFSVGDKVFLKISPRKGITQFGKRNKLKPRYIGPFEIIKRVGKVAYKLNLPPNTRRIHDVFHVSHLKKYYPDPSHILQLDTVELEEDLSYQERPIRILDKKIQELHNRRIPLVKVLWQNHGVEEATWEREDELRRNHPKLFNEPTGTD
ncbi:UNVERIFIED_CONTAM: Transposon Ty3-I Gag-Pol polyprotein [Sesamum radiatum]|uniref:Transposon Ty3-I Gag-Pol polyprotein n=1 Tax=Sesamum radiatum TaxID=300843 RepID=A0AAW2TXN7_SESRA